MIEVIEECFFDNIWYDQRIYKGEITDVVSLDIGPFTGYVKILNKMKF